MMFDDPLSFLSIVIWLAAASMWPVGFLFGVCSECVDCCGVRLSFERCVKVTHVGGWQALVGAETQGGRVGGHCPIFLGGPGGRGEAPFVQGNALRVVDSPARVTVPIRISLSSDGASRTPIGTTRYQTWRFKQASVADTSLYDIVGPPWHLQVDLEVTGVASQEDAGVIAVISADEFEQPKLTLRVKQAGNTITHTEQVALFPVGLQRSDDSTFRLTGASRNATLEEGASVTGWLVSKQAGIVISERAITLRFDTSFYCYSPATFELAGPRFVFNSELAVDFLEGKEPIRLPVRRRFTSPPVIAEADFEITPANLLCGVPASDLLTGVALGIYPAEISALVGEITGEPLSPPPCNQTIRMRAAWGSPANAWGTRSIFPVGLEPGMTQSPIAFYDGWSLLWSATEGPARQRANADRFLQTIPTVLQAGGSMRTNDTFPEVVAITDCTAGISNQLEIEGTWTDDRFGTGITYDMETDFFCGGKWVTRFSGPIVSAFEPQVVTVGAAGIFRNPESGQVLTDGGDQLPWNVVVTVRGNGSSINYCNEGAVTAVVESYQFFILLFVEEQSADGTFFLVRRPFPISPNATVTSDILYNVVQNPLLPVPLCTEWSPAIGPEGGTVTRTCSGGDLTESWTIPPRSSRLPIYSNLASSEVAQTTGIVRPGICRLDGLVDMNASNNSSSSSTISNPLNINSVLSGSCRYYAPAFNGYLFFSTLPCGGCTPEVEIKSGDENARVRLVPSGPKAGAIEIVAKRDWPPGLGVTIGVTCGNDTITQTIRRTPGDPSPPRNLVVDRDPCSTAVLTWTVPEADGGSPILRYLVQFRRIGVSSWTTFGNVFPPTVSATITGLLRVGYEFRVIAVNETGPSEQSNIAVSGFALAAATNLAVVRDPCTQAELSWTPPQQAECVVVASYRLEFRAAGVSSWTIAGTVLGTQTTGSIAGLIAETVYQFRVARIDEANTVLFTSIVSSECPPLP